MMVRHAQSGRINLLTLLLIAALTGGIGYVVLFGPYYWDYLVMREVTQAAVLEWYNSESRAAGEKRLERELVKNDIPSYIDESHCGFDTDIDTDGHDILIVSCSWSAYVYYPYTDDFKQLDFSATTEVDINRNLSTY